MEFHAADPIVLTNANVVAADRVFPGWVAVAQGRIAEIGEGRGPKGGIDCQATICCPVWSSCTPTISSRISCRARASSGPAGSAVMAYDAQIAGRRHHHRIRLFRLGMTEYEDWRVGVGEAGHDAGRGDRTRPRRRPAARDHRPTCAARSPRPTSSSSSKTSSRAIRRGSCR